MNNGLTNLEMVKNYIKQDRIEEWNKYVRECVDPIKEKELMTLVSFINMLGGRKLGYLSMVNFLKGQGNADALLSKIQFFYEDGDNFALAYFNPDGYEKREQERKVEKYISEGKPYIFPEKQQEWEEFVKDKVADPFFQGVEAEVLIKIMKLLDIRLIFRAKDLLEDSIAHVGPSFKEDLIYFYKNSHGSLEKLFSIMDNNQSSNSFR